MLEPEPRLLMKAEHENKDLHFPNEYGSFIVDLNKSLVTRCPVPTATPHIRLRTNVCGSPLSTPKSSHETQIVY